MFDEHQITPILPSRSFNSSIISYYALKMGGIMESFTQEIIKFYCLFILQLFHVLIGACYWPLLDGLSEEKPCIRILTRCVGDATDVTLSSFVRQETQQLVNDEDIGLFMD